MRQKMPRKKAPLKPGKGRPNATAIRWTISRAASEFGWHATTLERARRAAGVNAGPDGKFSTRQICQIVFGDKEAALIKKLESDQRNADLKYARDSAELVPTALVVKLDAAMIIPMRQRIMSSSMTDQEKRDLLGDMEAFGNRDWAAEIKRHGAGS